MGNYIITDEDGQHYITDNYTESDFDAMCMGLLTIIRLPDGSILKEDGEWAELSEWENNY